MLRTSRVIVRMMDSLNRMTTPFMCTALSVPSVREK
jgi:hypothetical protein